MKLSVTDDTEDHVLHIMQEADQLWEVGRDNLTLIETGVAMETAICNQ